MTLKDHEQPVSLSGAITAHSVSQRREIKKDGAKTAMTVVYALTLTIETTDAEAVKHLIGTRFVQKRRVNTADVIVW